MKVKRTYEKSKMVLSSNSDWNESIDVFDKLLLNNEKTTNTKLSVKEKIRASFNRNSSLDETKLHESITKAKKQQQLRPKSRKKLLEPSHDEFYECYLRDKKQKLSLKKSLMKSVQKVQVSTPVQKKLSKKNSALEFKVSPIRLNDSVENVDSSTFHYNSLKQQRIDEIKEAQKDLDSTAIKEAKQLLETIQSHKILRRSENIPEPDVKSSKIIPIDKPDRPIIFRRQETSPIKLLKDKISNVENAEQPATAKQIEPPRIRASSKISLDKKKTFSPAVRQTRKTSALKQIDSPVDKKSKSKKSVAIDLVPAVKDVSYYIEENDFVEHNQDGRSVKKSVIFPEDSTCDQVRLKLSSGKWRRSLIAWRSVQNATRQTTVLSEPIEEPVLKKSRYAGKMLATIGDSVLLEQSDDGTLQTALSILDASIKSAATFHDQRKTSQRKTSVFQRSSIFYGLQEPVINVECEPSLLNARQIALRRCGQQEPLPFDEIYSESQLPNCCKIGEGVYGEVFMYKCPTTHQPIVLKIIPIEGDLLVNGEPQKRFDEILQEIVISMELSGMRYCKDYSTDGFVNVKRVTCVQGAYPEHLIDEWELYRDNRAEGSDNDHPEIFPFDQLYIVFELCNGGRDLEAFVFNNAEESQSVFLQTALTLAVAERKFEFEHRDLHWGNILIAPTTDKFAEFRVDGEVVKLLTHGVKVTIIDYSLSRMVYDGAVLYDNLARDEELFQSSGDYQFDIYRLMRDRLENKFERYEPFTNLLWLHYIVDKLINGARYRYSKTKKHRAAINDMMLERDELLNYTSAFDYIKTLEF